MLVEYFSVLALFPVPFRTQVLTVSILEADWWMKGKNPISIEKLSLMSKMVSLLTPNCFLRGVHRPSPNGPRHTLM